MTQQISIYGLEYFLKENLQHIPNQLHFDYITKANVSYNTASNNYKSSDENLRKSERVVGQAERFDLLIDFYFRFYYSSCLDLSILPFFKNFREKCARETEKKIR